MSGRPPMASQQRETAAAIHPDMPAGTALRRLLRQQLILLEGHLPGSTATEDAEALHDFRVALRRTRTLIGQFAGLFPSAELQPFRSGFKWLGTVTAPTRDLDVHLLGFPAMQKSLAKPYRSELLPLRQFLVRRREATATAMAAELAGPRCRELLASWRRFLEEPAAGGPSPAGAARPIGPLAGKRIGKLFTQCLEQGRGLSGRSPAAALHRLRIRGKQLRYLLEFFRTCYPPGPTGKLIEALKQLQDNLGAYQDLTVQALALDTFARQMLAEGEASAPTLLAMGMLINQLHQRREEVHSRFATNFSDFSSGRNRTRLQRLLAPSASRQPAP